ncbi:MAG: hypothetical protein H6719_28155 [Sandaracinaceae bacterium]|nr:hypothetical protein [Sandaracinaceae bacterium]
MGQAASAAFEELGAVLVPDNLKDGRRAAFAPPVGAGGATEVAKVRRRLRAVAQGRVGGDDGRFSRGATRTPRASARALDLA